MSALLEESMTLDVRRKKLLFRAWRRGFREMDLLMGGFADAHIAALTEEDLDEFERLLGTPDWEVFAWLVGQKPVPANFKSPVLDQLIGFRHEAQSG
jgi:antitoxin CptB